MVAYETKECVKHKKQIIYKKEAPELSKERLAYDQSKSFTVPISKLCFVSQGERTEKEELSFHEVSFKKINSAYWRSFSDETSNSKDSNILTWIQVMSSYVIFMEITL